MLALIPELFKNETSVQSLYNFIVKSGLYCNMTDIKSLVNLFGKITHAASLGEIANERLQVARGAIYKLFSLVHTRCNWIICVISFNCRCNDSAVEKIHGAW